MERRRNAYSGCLLGLAVGDGLGSGPERENGFLPMSSHSQMAAYGCNGLLLGVTRGQLDGTMAPPVRYVAQALTEWARRQRFDREGSVRCWISRSPRMDFRRCQEPGVLDVLTEGRAGTMEDHSSSHSGAGALMTGVAAGLFYDPERLSRKEIHRLAAEAAALTHGDPAAFLSAAAMAHILSRILFDGEEDMSLLTWEAGQMLRSRFGREYHQVRRVREKLKEARNLARSRRIGREEAVEKLGCVRAEGVLAAAMYCAMTDRDFTQTMELAAKCMGRGAAAVGAVLGAKYGEECIPEEWLEELECRSVLQELAWDMFRGCPMSRGDRVFDIEWDEKYNADQL